MVTPQRNVYFYPDKEVTLEEVKKRIDVIHSHDPVVVPSGSINFENTAHYLVITVAFLHLMNILM